jgi:hypothetical protein
MLTNILCCGSPEVKPRRKDKSSWKPIEYEAMLIKATWIDENEDLSNLGTEIYMYIFENNPHVRTLFPKIHQHGENWRSSKEVEMQGYLFATVSWSKNGLIQVFSERLLIEKLYPLNFWKIY